ncbi:hypothetical protein AVL50_31455 [Flammeovirga sp. SJP92]|nr:hypothetical protein AVL50_31455 [Flammeovirga sp. SJP92]
MKHNSRFLLILSSIILLIFFEGETLKQSLGWNIDKHSTMLSEWFFSDNSKMTTEVELEKNESNSSNSY